mmetsp:Transcript_51366/g.60037  ORF Transcript_51366/g.60037 Transcript_51366/m.60037 type:complete len:252 (-) Transcript_51366:87-842(-)|eukprot:CAMPEP_0194379036 /NCGR_PEP_ID=MMETSP0174-20130528/37654_1 /TAXON_ID=216777 /ORGANISM="Proboscia alata, Strain PI-D3" /LENGTH=251 /DNA_ID=CAMNT_0039161453 /DNA_START=37 /DNA_END=792 /DNA_ORIENTATION=-
MMHQYYGLQLLIISITTALIADAFLHPSSLHHIRLQSHQRHTFAPPPHVVLQHEQNSIRIPSLQMAGFGGGASAKKGGNKKNKKDTINLKLLKPKQQWDRYTSSAMKGFDSIRVAVRVVRTINSDTTDEGSWLEVGAVKSKENAYTEAAVIRHRVLIADHARRMFPLQVLAKDKLEWGYSTTAARDEDEDVVVEWTVAGKVDDMPADIDKLIGFQGLPEQTGFYARSTESKGIGQTGTQADFDTMMAKRIV